LFLSTSDRGGNAGGTVEHESGRRGEVFVSMRGKDSGKGTIRFTSRGKNTRGLDVEST